MARKTRREPRFAPLIVLHLKLFPSLRRDDGRKKDSTSTLNSTQLQKLNSKPELQEADAARDELAATSARDGPAFLELCDRLREQRYRDTCWFRGEKDSPLFSGGETARLPSLFFLTALFSLVFFYFFIFFFHN